MQMLLTLYTNLEMLRVCEQFVFEMLLIENSIPHNRECGKENVIELV